MRVPPSGPTDAKLYIAGEAPGSTEAARGIPFCGPSGNLLWQTLLTAGIRRDDCRVYNVLEEQPPDNKMEAAPEEQIKAGVLRLMADIKSVKPNLVLALGATTLKYLSGHFDIGNWRGSLVWNSVLGCKVLHALHPAFILRFWDAMPLFMFDCQKAVRESKSPGHVPIIRDFVLNPTFSQVVDYVDLMRKQAELALDIETFVDPSDLLSKMRCIAFAWSRNNAICIPYGKTYWKEDQQRVHNLIQTLCEDPKVRKVTQNGQFDLAVLKEAHGIVVENMTFDTMCAMHVAYPELPKSLATICSIFTDQPYYKWKKASEDSTEFYEYNALDAVVTFEAAQELKQELKELGVFDFYNQVVHPLIPVMIELQHNGVRVDTEKMFALKMHFELEYQKCLAELKALFGIDINPNSPKQLKTLLYDVLELPQQVKDGKLRTDELALKALEVTNKDNPVFKLILRARRSRKMASTYLDLGLTRKGRMHTSYNIGGSLKDVSTGRVKSAPETGRISSSYSIVLNCGTNLQNITRGVIRTIYIAEPGEVLFEADLSQAEARVVAYVADEPRLIRVFEEGLDVHKLNACWIEEIRSGKKVSVGEVTKEQRQFAKTHVHAFNYDEGPVQFAKRAGVSIAQGRQIQARYFQEYPGVKLYHYNIQSQLRKDRTLFTLLGRRRTFFGRMDEATFRSAYSYIPQGTVGDLLNIILICCLKKIRCGGLKAKAVLQVHDSIVFSATEAELPALACILNDSNMKLRAGRHEFLIPLEFKVDKNWGEMKEWKNAPASG